MTYDFLGYIATTIVVISFILSDIKNFRLLNSLGGFLFILYGVLIESNPVILMNVVITLINLIQLWRLYRKRHF